MRQFNQRVVNELKVSPTLSSEITSHGAGALGGLQYAAMAVLTGSADYVLCTSGDASGLLLAPGSKFSSSAAGEADPQFEAIYGPSTPSLYAQAAQRYLYESGATNEHMAMVGVENRKWALHQPDAAMRYKGPITVEDVLNSPMIASPLHMLDCAPWYPGAIATAMVVTSRERAEERQAQDALRLLRRHVLADDGAHRMADQMGFLDAGVVHHREHVLGEAVDRERSPERRAARALEVRADHGEPAREQRYLRKEGVTGAAEAVHHDERGAAALLLDRERLAVHFDHGDPPHARARPARCR